MRRTIAVFVCALLLASAVSSCSDDRVTLRRGPLGPASYELSVRATGSPRTGAEEHRARLDVTPARGGANFSVRTTSGEYLTAELSFSRNGSANLARIRGGVTSGQELASLVGQLAPPLPSGPVRLGKRWSSVQRIDTEALKALLRTSLHMVRFTREASTDAAELAGDVTGVLRVSGGPSVLQGRLTGRTRIVWAVAAGRVVAADTDLVWTLNDGSRVTLQTIVRPR